MLDENVRDEMLESGAELSPNYLLYNERLCVAVTILVVLILKSILCSIVSQVQH